MNTDETTRIEFAERQGWKRHLFDVGVWVDAFGNRRRECEAPNPTDRNHVHTALMGMSKEEWELFENLLWEGEVNGTPENETIQIILKSNLVAYFLEATKKRVNANRP